MTARSLASCVLVAALAVAFSSCGGGPKDASSITYEVSYADSSAGEADISYTGSDGRAVTTRVAIPWASGPVSVREGQSYRLDATAPDVGKNLSCDIRPNTGWTAGNSLRNGRCNYTFPDDLGE